MKRQGEGGPTDLEGAGDLLSAARRDQLGAAERHELERALDVDPSLRIAHEVGRDFDRIATVRSGDDELIARVTGRVLAMRGTVGRRRSDRRVAVAVGIGLALAASGAAAWWATWSAPRRQTDGQARPTAAPARVAAGRRTPGAEGPDTNLAKDPPGEAPAVTGGSPPAAPPVVPLAPGALLPPTGSSPASITHVVPPGRPRLAGGWARSASAARLAGDGRPAAGAPAGSQTALAPAAPSAATLFHDANAARHAGNLSSARGLYREVEARFPTSNEARLSRLSLGKLLLAAGDALEAEGEFAGYLSAGGGPLTEEALVGQAQCFERLGRTEDERRAWEQLLRDFPSSVYTARARQREARLTARSTTPAP